MKVFAFYIMVRDGTCIFSSEYRAMPQPALITAMISAMQAFILEVSGSPAKKVSTGGFVFHIDRVGKLIFVLACDSDTRPDTKMNQIRTRFLHKHGSSIESFNGVTDQFLPFSQDVIEVFDINVHEDRVEPSKQLNSFALLQIPKHLQDIARSVVMKKNVTVLGLSGESDMTIFEINQGLQELFEMGYIGRYFDSTRYVYFI